MIGKRVKILRKSLRLTQGEFVKKLGISRSHLSGIESERDPPSKPLLIAIVHHYNARLEWLENGEGEMLVGAEVGAVYPEGEAGALHVKEGSAISSAEQKIVEALREDPAALEQVRLYLQAKHSLGASAQVAIVVTPKTGE